MNKQNPILIDASQLNSQIGDANIQIINLCSSSEYKNLLLPGSMWVDHKELYNQSTPTAGLTPPADNLKELMSRIGLRKELQVIAYDDEGGGHASRLVWLLHLVKHRYASVLNGGIQNWIAEQFPTSPQGALARRIDFNEINRDESVIAHKKYIMEHLGDPEMILIDARTSKEYCGKRLLSKRGGHIPGAINLNWIESIDRKRNFRFKKKFELETMLDDKNISKDKEIIVYCQTHHRSAHSWVMFKHLNYTRVRGYAGSWGEWGNDIDVPINQ